MMRQKKVGPEEKEWAEGVEETPLSTPSLISSDQPSPAKFRLAGQPHSAGESRITSAEVGSFPSQPRISSAEPRLFTPESQEKSKDHLPQSQDNSSTHTPDDLSSPVKLSSQRYGSLPPKSWIKPQPKRSLNRTHEVQLSLSDPIHHHLSFVPGENGPPTIKSIVDTGQPLDNQLNSFFQRQKTQLEQIQQQMESIWQTQEKIHEQQMKLSKIQQQMMTQQFQLFQQQLELQQQYQLVISQIPPALSSNSSPSMSSYDRKF